MVSIVRIVDIDECALGTADCSHMCTNNLGYFECSCRFGYRLQADGKTCEGRIEFESQLSLKLIWSRNIRRNIMIGFEILRCGWVSGQQWWLQCNMRKHSRELQVFLSHWTGVRRRWSILQRSDVTKIKICLHLTFLTPCPLLPLYGLNTLRVNEPFVM